MKVFEQERKLVADMPLKEEYLQVDITPTLALLTGVPIPRYGSSLAPTASVSNPDPHLFRRLDTDSILIKIMHYPTYRYLVRYLHKPF